MDIKPYNIDIDEATLDDLNTRLAHTRWPDEETPNDWSQGVPLAYAKEVCQYWAKEYDWRNRQQLMNRFDHFTAEIDGLSVHFIHQRSPVADARPLFLQGRELRARGGHPKRAIFGDPGGPFVRPCSGPNLAQRSGRRVKRGRPPGRGAGGPPAGGPAAAEAAAEAAQGRGGENSDDVAMDLSLIHI